MKRRKAIDIVIEIVHATACALALVWLCSCSASARVSRDTHEEAREREEIDLSVGRVASADAIDLFSAGSIISARGTYRIRLYDTSMAVLCADGTYMSPVAADVEIESQVSDSAFAGSVSTERIAESDAVKAHGNEVVDRQRNTHTDTDLRTDLMNGAFAVMVMFTFLTLFIKGK